MNGKRRARRWLTFDRRILLLTLLAGLPAVIVSMSLLWFGDYTSKVQWTLTVLVLCFWFGFAMAQQDRAVFTLRTVSNLLEALREGDYSVRARDAGDDAMGEVMLQLNRIGETMRQQRLGRWKPRNCCVR
jgi:two-component system, NtrC family, nitrogen regulation sensor histidine kinase NtrY